jgi:hypothetical protein
MFIQTWKKYLPVIILLMKRSINGAQVLNVNYTDFQRAAGGRKIRFSFSDLKLENGKASIGVKHAAVATDLCQLLQEDKVSRQMIRDQNFEFSLSPEFQLTIRNLSLTEAVSE